MNKPISLEIGSVIGRLTIIERAGIIKTHTSYRVKCLCGNEKTVAASDILRGKIKSCGCLKNELTVKRSTTHSLSRNPLYPVWKDFMSRCYNKKCRSYKNYGGRGIKVHEDWHDPTNFIRDCPPKPDGYHQIDRIENDGDYAPGNIKWSTRSQNMRNVRHNFLVEYQGKQRLLIDVAEELGIGYYTIRARIVAGSPHPFRPVKSAAAPRTV